jgi:hypothetical protein
VTVAGFDQAREDRSEAGLQERTSGGQKKDNICSASLVSNKERFK